jgi:hypothetical protein
MKKNDSEINWYRERLEDISLLDKAIRIENGYLLVPVGGKRISGCCDVGNLTNKLCRAIIKKLDKKLFPNARLYDDKEEGTKSIEWGEDIFMTNSLAERGRMFGYREEILFDTIL